MRHKIVLTPSIEGTEFLKNLAGLIVDPSLSFGVRYFKPLDLAKYLMQCNGIICPKQFITNVCLSARLYHKVKAIEYFEKVSFTDVFELLKSVNELRHCIASNETVEIKKLLNAKSFKRKNLAVVEFYDLLMKTLDDENLIDEIGLIRYAIDNSKAIANTEFVYYQEFEYTDLSIALLNRAAGEKVAASHLFSSDKPNISTYTKAFGQNSEIEDILAFIYENNIKFDECVIAASDTSTYGKILSNYQAVLNFPLVVNSGQSVVESSCGRLFGLMLSWMNNHNHLDFLTEVINAREFNVDKFKEDIGYDEVFANDTNYDLNLSKYDVFSFDLIIKMVGNLKLGINDFDNTEIKNNQRLSDYESVVKDRLNKDPNNNIYKRDLIVLDFVKKVNQIFNKGIESFLDDYLIIDESNISVESNAFEKYKIMLSLAKEYDISLLDAVKFLANVVVGKRNPKEGALFLTSIDNAISSIRKHLFIVGLDSKTFPGKVTENPIILDQDYELFGIKEASSKKMNDNKRLYHDLIDTATELKVDIHLSYAYYNSETAKEQNASSVFFETYRKENGDGKTINDLNNEFVNNKAKYRMVGFFDKDLFPLSVLGRKAKTSPNVVIESTPVVAPIDNDVDTNSLISSRGLSFSAIEKYIECKYKFFLYAILHIDQENDTDIYQLVPANELGTIVHEIMEEYTPIISKKDFLSISKQKFKEYLIAHPSDNPEQEKVELDDFLDIMSNAYDMEKIENSPSTSREEDFFAFHKGTHLKIHGLPDKVTKLYNGTYRIVDYKTGNTIKHDPNDLDSMLQGAVYAYILENGKNKINNYGNTPIHIDEFVFRYLKYKKNVSSFDNNHSINDYLNRLDEVLLEINESLKTGKFEQSGNCKDCYFKDVCGGKKQ